MSYKKSPTILEWVAYRFSSRSSWPRNQTRLSCIAGRFFTNWDIKEAQVAHSCLTLCDPMDCVHGILQSRILERVAFPFSRGSSQSRDWTQLSCTAGGFLTSWATRDDPNHYWNGASSSFPHLSESGVQFRADLQPGGSDGKESTCSEETQVWSLG